jgi:hypothetical protein
MARPTVSKVYNRAEILKARPTARDRHVDTAMSNISIRFQNENYIADQVFPVVNVQKKSDVYFVFDRASWFRDQIGPRAPGTRARRVDFSITTSSYLALPYALGKSITDEERDNSDAALQPDIEATEYVTDKLLMGLEIRVANIVSTSTNWASASNLTSGTKWTSDSSTPTANIITLKKAVRQRIGRYPNVAVMGAAVMERLIDHPEMIDRIKYTRPGAVLTMDDLAQWFGFQKLLVGEGVKVTTDEGQADTFADIWGDFFWCGWVPGAGSLRTPAAGYVFEWKGRVTERFREDQEKQDVVAVEHHTDERITASDSGAIYSDLL